MRSFSRIASAVVIALVALASCKSQYELLLQSNDVEPKYKAAFDYFQQGKYQKAAGMFESLSLYTGGTPQEDTVQYYWGLSNYRFRDYYTAEANFTKFMESFPGSPFYLDVVFLRIDCLYRQTLRYELDQAPTYTCINAINEYLAEYPNTDRRSDCQAIIKELSDRLDKKDFENAKLYYKMEDYQASRVAFKNILKDDPENIYREDILYYIALSSYKYANLSITEKQKERYLVFMDDYLNFVSEVPESPYARELAHLYVKAQKATGNYTGIEEDVEIDERVFDKDRKSIEKATRKEQIQQLKAQKALDKAARKEMKAASIEARKNAKAESKAEKGK